MEGKKTYIAAITGIATVLAGYFGYDLTAEQMTAITSIFMLLISMTIRHGVKTENAKE